MRLSAATSARRQPSAPIALRSAGRSFRRRIQAWISHDESEDSHGASSHGCSSRGAAHGLARSHRQGRSRRFSRHGVGVPMKTRDGVTLRADIYRSKEDGKFPVLLQRTPYDKNYEQRVQEGARNAARGIEQQFPRFDRNMNTGEENGRAKRFVPATNMIVHDAEHPSTLILPLVK